MSGSVAFNSIPNNLRVPLFYVEFDPSQGGVSQQTQRALLLGQSINAVPSAVTYVPSAQWAAGQYGPGSQLAAEIAAYRANDPVTELWALPYADASGSAAASGSFAITGPATAAGTLPLYVAGQQVPVGVSSGDNATTIGANVAAAINAWTGNVGGAILTLPVAATASAGTVTVTAKNKGTNGNYIPLTVGYYGAQGGESVPAGVSVSITAMTGGSGDPVLSGLGAALGTTTYDFIGHPWGNTTELTATSAVMSDQSGRWSYSSQLYGHVFSAQADTVANLLTLGGAPNDQHLTVFGLNPASPTPRHVWAGALLGAVAPALIAQPARPLQTLPVNAVLPAPSGSRYSFSNNQSLLNGGIALADAGATNQVQIIRAVTTYLLNRFGVADTSYLDTETLFTSMLVVRTLKGAITNKFPRAIVVQDGTRIGYGQSYVTPSLIRGELIAQYAAMEKAGLVQNAAGFAKGLFVTINANDPSRVDVLFDPRLATGLRIFAVLNQFRVGA